MTKKIVNEDRMDAQFKEEELVRMAQTGDVYAEEFLIWKYKELVKSRAHLYFIAGADRDDIIQEGMIGIFKAIRDYNDEKLASFRTFAEICITRQIITAIKRATRLKHGPLNSYISLSKPVSEEDPYKTLSETLASNKDSDPESLLLLKEEMDYIETNGADIFSDLEWRVWTEYLQGKTYTQIAKETKKTPKSIDNAIQRIKKKLELYLTK
jgi:RNA polymerase sporulation-specific sigma factor